MIEMWFPTLIDVSVLDQFKPNNDSYAQCVYNVREKSPKVTIIIEKYAKIEPATVNKAKILSLSKRFL